MKKIAAVLSAVFACVFLAYAVPCAVFAASDSAPKLTAKDLDASLKYYEKTSTSEKLNNNDRLAILLRIREKYEAAGLDIGRIDKEIARRRAIRDSERAPSSESVTVSASTASVKAEPSKPKSPSRRRLSSVQVTEKADVVEILVVSDNPDSRNVFVLKDPDPKVPPKIVADFYGLTEALPSADKDIAVGGATIERIRTAQFDKEPSPVARMVVYLKKNVRHTFKDSTSGFLLIVAKDDSEKGKMVTAFAAAISSTSSAAPVAALPVTVTAPSVLASTPIAVAATSSSFDPRAAARAAYKIEPGDVLYVTVTPAEEITREVTVNPGGEISLPLAGIVRAAGITPAQLAEDIKIALSKYITNPEVSVTVRQYARRTIFITGELKSTGGYPYKEGMRLLELISQAGGFTDRADRKNVKVLRGEGAVRKTFIVDVEDLMRSGDFTKDFALEPQDIVEVPAGFKKISVLGDVRTPGYYDYKDGMKVVEIVSMSGGFLDTARVKEVTILRKQGADTKSIKVDLDAVLKGHTSDVPLAPEDTVYIPRKSISTANWWASSALPWLTLISLILVIRGGL
ncbi:MAG: hypothetical protein CVU77_01075 [Elusimicrobia bacterium HGW-Elusimicrobia-1]|jgi:polysaccharide export outer membrane protein|nr:MAG: hypothetical protein CVU77_01075 [Elusimicrobia bacterium HGW-Elusimicrobia-1]